MTKKTSMIKCITMINELDMAPDKIYQEVKNNNGIYELV